MKICNFLPLFSYFKGPKTPFCKKVIEFTSYFRFLHIITLKKNFILLGAKKNTQTYFLRPNPMVYLVKRRYYVFKYCEVELLLIFFQSKFNIVAKLTPTNFHFPTTI